ncbi:hypothetical protein ROS1_28530 [Roseibium sp. ROS1]
MRLFKEQAHPLLSFKDLGKRAGQIGGQLPKPAKEPAKEVTNAR